MTFTGCFTKNDIDKIVLSEWKKCKNEYEKCIVDFSNLMPFEWDTLYYYTGAVLIEDIEKEIGTRIPYEDVGSRIIFMKDGKITYYKEWFPYPEPKPDEPLVFAIEGNKLKLDTSNAIFRVEKKNNLLFLYPIE